MARFSSKFQFELKSVKTKAEMSSHETSSWNKKMGKNWKLGDPGRLNEQESYEQMMTLPLSLSLSLFQPLEAASHTHTHFLTHRTQASARERESEMSACPFERPLPTLWLGLHHSDPSMQQQRRQQQRQHPHRDASLTKKLGIYFVGSENESVRVWYRERREWERECVWERRDCVREEVRVGHWNKLN